MTRKTVVSNFQGILYHVYRSSVQIIAAVFRGNDHVLQECVRDNFSNTSIVPATFSAAGKRDDNKKKKKWEWGVMSGLPKDCHGRLYVLMTYRKCIHGNDPSNNGTQSTVLNEQYAIWCLALRGCGNPQTHSLSNLRAFHT